MQPKQIKRFVLLSGIISSVICFNGNVDFALLPLLPLLYGLLYYALIPHNIYLGAGFITVSVVLYIRYIVYPVELQVSNYDIIGTASLAQSAILLMCYEMFIILLVIRFAALRDKKSAGIKPTEISHAIPIVALLVLMFITAVHPEAFANRRWIWQSELINEETVVVSGVLLQLAQWCEFLVIIYFFSLLWRKFLTSRKQIYYYLSILILFIPCLTYTGHSRLSLLIPLICYIFFILKIYGTKAVGVTRFVCVYAIVAMAFLSLFKVVGSSSVAGIDGVSDYSLLNSYFAGVDNVIMGIEAYERFGMSPYYFVIDSFRNMMGVSQYFEYIPSTLQHFNTAVYSHLQGFSMDQIPPTICQGLMYFGPLFCIIPTIIMTLSVCYADKIFAKTTNPLLAYLCLGFVVAVAWAIPGSYMHLMTRVFNYLLPLYLLVILCKYTKVKI